MINLPLIPDTLAVRAVVYDDSRGGYINNVPATFTRQSTDEGFSRYNGGVVPTNSVSINNAAQVGNAINPVTYQGFRLSGLLKINDNWNALLQQSYQNMNAQACSTKCPMVPRASPSMRSASRWAAVRCRRCRWPCSILPTTRTSSRTPSSR